MKKVVYRYFFDFVDTQERWLNEMARSGYRLTRCSKLAYEFEACEAGEYEYAVEFVADKSAADAKYYRQFLDEMGYRTFAKNININFSIGKLRWRPWARGGGRIATKPGGYDSELIIVEKARSASPLELHTDMRELADYYATIRNSYLTAVFLFAIFGIIGFTPFINLTVPACAASCALSALFFIPAMKYARIAGRYRRISKTNE